VLDEESAECFANLFKTLSDPARLRLLSLIASYQPGETCVCDLVNAFSLSQPTISHHLRILREAGLVESQRRGIWVYYRVTDEAAARLSALLEAAGLQAPPWTPPSPVIRPSPSPPA
jgi:ArsR family transcriptional regulator